MPGVVVLPPQVPTPSTSIAPISLSISKRRLRHHHTPHALDPVPEVDERELKRDRETFFEPVYVLPSIKVSA